MTLCVVCCLPDSALPASAKQDAGLCWVLDWYHEACMMLVKTEHACRELHVGKAVAGNASMLVPVMD